MYSERLLLTSHIFDKVASLLGANPILFNYRTKTFYTTPYSRLTTRFNMILLIIQIIFGTFRLVTFGNLSKKSDHELFIFNVSYILVLAMFVPLICLVILTFNCQDEVDCLNQTLRYTISIREKWISLNEKEFFSSYPTGYFLEYFNYLVAVTVAGYTFFGCVGIYVTDILPLHWLSLIPVRLRSRGLFWAYLAFYGNEMMVASVSIGISLLIVSSYVAFAISAACGAYPLRFDHKSVRFYTTRISRWPCLGFTAVSLIQLVFSLVRNIQLGQSMVTKEEIYMFNVTYLIVLGHVIPLICTLLIILQPDDFVLVLNRVVGYALDVKRRYVSERKDFWFKYPTGLLLELFVLVVALGVVFYAFSQSVAVYLLKPLPSQWITLFTKKYFHWRLLFWPHLLFYTYFVIISSFAVGGMLSLGAAYLALIIPFNSTEFNPTRPSSSHITDSSFRSASQLPINYNAFVLLHRLCNDVLSPAIIPFQSLVLKFSIYCNWMLLAHWESLGFLRLVLACAELCMITLWSGFLEIAGTFHAKSVKNRQSWRHLAESERIFRKWRKAAKPLYFGHPGLHKIKKLSVLKFGKAIIRGTFRTLVTFKSI
ncbi:hypothetical protein Fcan01_16943 [Folsomia candida]|uniref:Uncharacterized protein n=1 Tax=Folsomia candida TaxID=158441 RepID=A0A226DTC0_FOLCA|nr:hypothetical protein Fcan01_16943 [Folsomia candida]